jgi:hypothetical protein
LWDGAGGWVLCALSDGGEVLSGWVVGLLLVRGMCGSFVWVETFAKSSGGIVRAIFKLRTTVGAKCWDQEAEGYSILNTEGMQR